MMDQGQGMGCMGGMPIPMESTYTVDAHGSDSQKSDPNAPQGDEQRVFNMVRLVRDANYLDC